MPDRPALEPHVIRLLGPWREGSATGTATVRVPGVPQGHGRLTMSRRFQWVAALEPGVRLCLVLPPLPADAVWSVGAAAFATTRAGQPATLPLPALARSNELLAAFDDWPAGAEFPGVALAALADV